MKSLDWLGAEEGLFFAIASALLKVVVLGLSYLRSRHPETLDKFKAILSAASLDR